MEKQPVVTRQHEGQLLNNLGTQTKFLCTGEKTGKAWSLMEVVLPRHSGPPPHAHPWDQAYYVIEGQVRFLVSGQEHLIEAGDFLYAPGDIVHAFEGQSEQPARLLIFDAPAHAEFFFRTVDAEVMEMPRDMDRMLEIGDRHQVRFARP